ncbi:2036_t:CDS:2 [Funneliformis geosporum]|nr:2036_t:CDS:2 [Funneliformis geosporum]
MKVAVKNGYDEKSGTVIVEGGIKIHCEPGSINFAEKGVEIIGSEYIISAVENSGEIDVRTREMENAIEFCNRKGTYKRKGLVALLGEDLEEIPKKKITIEKKQDFEEALEEKEKELEENKTLSQQALQENQDHEKPEETKEEELEKKLEEIVQQLQEQEVAQAASQKTMTKFMLFLIIFLMEYVVYKKNGVPDQIMEYADLFGHYLLIIAYVAGNVLAYNSVENPDYKMPMVYAQKTYQQQIDNLRQEYQQISQSKYNIYTDDLTAKTQELVNFQTFIQQREEATKKEEEMTKQAETLQKAAEMEQQLKDSLSQAQDKLKEPRIT